ncbi:ABC transporter permease [filamentous cyanobacterium LEGE 11480]|uniref:ABC transporter permease n=2 Tax=Romeriopsis TaxID=2992131 RepID=A0A928Z293_9CYAN|nr:ABC transporter permease [Romeriopsis navalis LEGE 11480]
MAIVMQAKPSSMPKTKFSFPWQTAFALLMLGFLYLPILVMAVYSLNESASSAKWTGVTLKWYARALQDERMMAALGTSLQVAVISVAISAVVGTLMAVGLSRYRFPGKVAYQTVAYLPPIVPDITMGVATLVALATFAVPLSFWTIVAAHVVFCLAYVALTISTRINDLDPNLEEAALDLGATPFQAFIKVLLPELSPAILSGCLLAFALSMDDLVISSFTSGGGASTLPMEIFSRIRRTVKPDLNALSVLLLVISGGAAIAAEVIRYRSAQKRLQG